MPDGLSQHNFVNNCFVSQLMILVASNIWHSSRFLSLKTHIQEFTRRIQNSGLSHEFQIKTCEKTYREEFPEDDWTADHPLC
jgi:hypothetical protein